LETQNTENVHNVAKLSFPLIEKEPIIFGLACSLSSSINLSVFTIRLLFICLSTILGLGIMLYLFIALVYFKKEKLETKILIKNSNSLIYLFILSFGIISTEIKFLNIFYEESNYFYFKFLYFHFFLFFSLVFYLAYKIIKNRDNLDKDVFELENNVKKSLYIILSFATSGVFLIVLSIQTIFNYVRKKIL